MLLSVMNIGFNGVALQYKQESNVS